MTIKTRPCHAESQHVLESKGLHPILARLLASRGIKDPTQIEYAPKRLLNPSELKGIKKAAKLITDAINQNCRICVIADYDCDGATACAVAIRGLKALGAKQVDFLVPNRFEHGYGLTCPIVELAAQHPRLGKADYIVTVDSGIASVEGVKKALEYGMHVIITDHHLPGNEIPPADAIVNPNQPGCSFSSKFLAGVGVIFYLLIAIRTYIRETQPNNPCGQAALQKLLDLVALGTVADLVFLDDNNRLLVSWGLERIRAGKACCGINALLDCSTRKIHRCTCEDLGFALGPRINAAGRLTDISIGILLLLTDDLEEARQLAKELSDINQERRSLQETMNEQALSDVRPSCSNPKSLVLHRPDWHEGLIGLVASKLKEQWNCPSIALACSSSNSDLLRGSGRSIPGLNLRDVLDWVNKKYPGIILQFGGHSMAAGLTLIRSKLQEFSERFEEAVLTLADPICFLQETLTDGTLHLDEATLSLLDLLEEQVWGQGFPPPLFSGIFQVDAQKVLQGKHLQMVLYQDGKCLEGIAFGRKEPLPSPAHIAYRLLRSEFRGTTKVKLLVHTALPTT